MSYSEIMICAFAAANGISREEALQSLKCNGLVPTDKQITIDLDSDPRTKDILNDLRKDPKGVLAWGLK